ncbi:MAG: response regulator transcription factor [Saprospiraceae bacterium]|nr:MAG: response regulator transcription factor [Saprospiraceae bacterium]
MEILIVEDEPLTAIDLANTIKEVEPAAQIIKMTDSIEATVSYLKNKPHIDLAFFDIQLADGLSFEIFKETELRCPVIFCTAFDEYALLAFQTNGVEYILKPFDEKSVGRAMEKVKSLANFYHKGNPDLEKIAKVMEQLQPSKKNNFLVNFQGKFFPISVKDIAFFTVLGDTTWLYTFKEESFYVPHSLEELESMLDERQFYRANRQYLINFAAVHHVENDFARKLSLKLSIRTPDAVIISKAKATDFLRWMNER